DFIAGFFVDEKHRGRGVGTALMAKLQATYSKLRLTVYQKNIRAAQFYKRQGFSFLTSRQDEGTGEAEDVMVWQK
ncbi:GNAT family N-acetyltransferase, partial [Lacticaseibacillus zeae]